MMTTPICDFVRDYASRGGLRLHMPGHKGQGPMGFEALDITEIAGADRLYCARGIIRESERNAERLFGSARTLYSTEGSSLCVRAMLYLALLHARSEGKTPVILAARNAHRTLMTAAALLDLDIRWLYPRKGSLLHCPISPEDLEEAIRREKPTAVFVTSPDYTGYMQDIAALSGICHAHGLPLLVDNAHGAYLKSLLPDLHPLTLGADLCCDSAHKTLPCLTGAAYLHAAHGAPKTFITEAERAMDMFASTSPSYLILQSLDAANRMLDEGLPVRFRECALWTQGLKRRLCEAGWQTAGNEPMKLTIYPKAYGYTGDRLHDLLRARHIECEFSDPDCLVVMPSPGLSEKDRQETEKALFSVPRLPAIAEEPPLPPRAVRACSIREAMTSPRQEIPVKNAVGRILADANAGCPPAVPILTAGEMITDEAVRCFEYSGSDTCCVVR